MSSLEFGLVQSIFTLGGLIGALAAGPISGKYGRLFTMRIDTVPIILGPFVTAFAPSVALMTVGRFLSGVGAGASLVVVPIFISEISRPETRGFYGSFTQIMTNAGIFIAQFIGYWLSHDSMWRVILAIAGIIGICQAIQLIFTVESPKWLGEHGRWKEARESLRKLRGEENSLDEEIKSWNIPTDNDLDERPQDPEHSPLLGPTLRNDSIVSTSQASRDLGFFDVLFDAHYRPAILAVLIVMASQQLTGINSIVMYGVGLLSSLLSSSSALLNIFVSLLNVFATTAFAPLSDNPRLGRKGCLMVSIAGMSVSSIFLGIGIKASIKVLSAISVLTFVTSFAFGLGPVPFMLASEMVDGKGVGATQSWALAGNWIATFIVAQFFPIVNQALGKGIVYFGFAILGALFLVSVWKFVPETRGREGMDEVWGFERRRANID